MPLPELDPSSRHREYDSYSEDLRAQVIRAWMFDGLSHRQIDEKVLGLDSGYSKGYQSMGILHFLGLKKEFRNLFGETDEFEAIAQMDQDPQDFSPITTHLEGNSSSSLVSLQELSEEESEELAKSKGDTSEARRARLEHADKKPPRLRVYSYTYRRNPDIVAEALIRANGICEDCGDPAPFNRRTDGTPFLEVHHKVSLACGGLDELDNVVALCPNCHRKAHHG